MESRFDGLVSDLCAEIDDLKWQLAESKREEKYWRDQFNEMLNGSLKHSQDMAGNMLKMLLTPGVTEVFVANADAEKFSA